MPISLERDTNGWTIFNPTADSRIMYVSNSGNDSTGQIYDYDDFVDPFNPGVVNAFLTYNGANANARSGYPDWILFERGNTFSANISPKSGKDADEFSLVGWYGSSGAAPLIKPATVTAAALDISYGVFQYIALVGLYFYSTTRDPDHDDYVGNAGAEAVYLYITYPPANRLANQILFEGCKFRFFKLSNLNDTDAGNVHDLLFHRCVLLDNYDDVAHSQGLFADCDEITVEDCIFDHNGWYHLAVDGAPGAATIYNHDLYIGNSNDITIKDSIFSRPSSMGLKFTANYPTTSTNLVVDNNLFLDCERAISMGGNDPGPLRFISPQVTDNVVTKAGRTCPTYDPGVRGKIAWGIVASDWLAGVLSGNLLVDFDAPGVADVHAIELSDGGEGVDVLDNVVYDIGSQSSTAHHLKITDSIPGSPGYTWTDFVVSGNRFQEPVGVTGQLLSLWDEAVLADFTFAGNGYYNGSVTTAFVTGGTPRSFAYWAGVSGETGSFADASLPDSTRNIETYMQHLGQTATVDAFIAKIRAMDRFNWDVNYTAIAVNAWIRAGFWTGEESMGFSQGIRLRF